MKIIQCYAKASFIMQVKVFTLKLLTNVCKIFRTYLYEQYIVQVQACDIYPY